MSWDCLSMLNFSVQFVPRSVWRGSTWSGRRRNCLASASVFRWWFEEEEGWRVHPSFWFKMKAPPRRDLFLAKRQPLSSAECTSISMITLSTLRHPTLSTESIAQISICLVYPYIWLGLKFYSLCLVNCNDCKDTINCPEKAMKISHFNQTNQCLLSILW